MTTVPPQQQQTIKLNQPLVWSFKQQWEWRDFSQFLFWTCLNVSCIFIGFITCCGQHLINPFLYILIVTIELFQVSIVPELFQFSKQLFFESFPSKRWGQIIFYPALFFCSDATYITFSIFQTDPWPFIDTHFFRHTTQWSSKVTYQVSFMLFTLQV